MRFLRRSRHSLLAVLATLSVAGGAGVYATGLPERAWPGGKARLCWAPDASTFKDAVPSLTIAARSARFPTAEERRFVRSTVESAFDPRRIGLSFLGFEPCVDTDEDADIQALLLFEIDLGSRVGGTATPGNYTSNASFVNRIEAFFGRERKSGLALNFAWIKNSTEDSIRSTVDAARRRIVPAKREFPSVAAALAKYATDFRADGLKYTVIHEFGHLAGLLHEERRADFAQENPAFCVNPARDALHEGIGPNEESRFGTEFDPFSVMNYCRELIQKYYHQARLVCALGADFREGAVRLGQSGEAVDRVLSRCDFVRANELPLALSARDVTALRKMYLDEDARPGVATGYKHSPVEREWIEVLGLVAKLLL